VAALWTAAYTDDPRGGRTTPYSANDFQLALANGEVLVAEVSQGIAGVVVLYDGGPRDGQVAEAGEFELSRLAVAEPCRREGIGRLLAENCLRLASERGDSMLVLWSRPKQTEAHRLYKSLGFTRLPDRDSKDSDGPRIVFARSLEKLSESGGVPLPQRLKKSRWRP